MYFSFIIWLYCLHIVKSDAESFIALRDYDFNTEDQVLKKNLAKRIYKHVEEKAPTLPPIARTSNLDKKPPKGVQPKVYGPQLDPGYKPERPSKTRKPFEDPKPDQGRQVAIARKPDLAQMPMLTPKLVKSAGKLALRYDYDDLFANNPYSRDFRRKFVGLMRQSIYGAQMRMKEMLLYTQKYDDNIMYRAGFMYKRLKVLESQMEIHLSIMQNWFDYTYRLYRYYSSLYFYLYYAYSLKNFIDITYIVEDIVAAYAEITKDQRAEAMVVTPPPAVDLGQFIPGVNLPLGKQ